MRFLITFLNGASLMAMVWAQAPFPSLTESVSGPIMSKVASDVLAYISEVYSAPAWTAISLALASEVPSLARDPSVNGDPISLAQAYLIATATPTWYPALPSDIKSFVYHVAAAEATIALQDAATSSAVFASATDGTNSRTSISASNPIGTGSSGTGSSGTSSSGASNSATSTGDNQSSSGWDQMPIGAKIGIIFGAIVAVSIIVFLGWCVWRRERRDRFDRMIATQHHNASGYDSGYSPGQTTYLPSTYLSPSAQPQKSSLLMQKPGYAPSEYYPVTEVDWQHENKEPRYAGTELGASDIASWRDGAHTIIAPTQR